MSLWKKLLQKAPEELSLPWFGTDTVSSTTRTWFIDGPKPQEIGWYRFSTDGGRKALLLNRCSPNETLIEKLPQETGYLIGNRFIQNNPKYWGDYQGSSTMNGLPEIHFVPKELDLFTIITICRIHTSFFFVRQEFPAGPEADVLSAFEDRKKNLLHIKEVTPPLYTAFKLISEARDRKEEGAALYRERAKAEILRREEEHRLQQLRKQTESAKGRRDLAQVDFDAAAKAALSISGATLIRTRVGARTNERVVTYRVGTRRLECVIAKDTLQVIDSGVCLTDEQTGYKGDTLLTLESLPGTIREADATGQLVVWRH